MLSVFACAVTKKFSSHWLAEETKRFADALLIDEFRYIKIQSQTIDFGTRLWGKKYRVCGVYSPEPRSEVYCLGLNFKISKLVYLRPFSLKAYVIFQL